MYKGILTKFEVKFLKAKEAREENVNFSSSNILLVLYLQEVVDHFIE